MSSIQCYQKHSNEYNRLRTAAAVLELLEPSLHFDVDDTYFDYGQDWRWTTIIATDPEKKPGTVLSKFQYLSPRDQEDIVSCTDCRQIAAVCENILGKKQKQKG